MSLIVGGFSAVLRTMGDTFRPRWLLEAPGLPVPDGCEYPPGRLPVGTISNCLSPTDDARLFDDSLRVSFFFRSVAIFLAIPAATMAFCADSSISDDCSLISSDVCSGVDMFSHVNLFPDAHQSFLDVLLRTVQIPQWDT